jgi:alanine dehydrogenase
MIVGTVREVKTEEYRVGLTPDGARELTAEGHRVLVETGAGLGSGYADEAYAAAGASLVPAESVWGESELVVKVKEPQEQEFPRLRHDLTLFTYLHLAAAPKVKDALLRAGTTAIAYETVELADHTLPLLVPMSQVAGRMATQVGAHWLEKPSGGRGKLLSGLPGSAPARVVIFGAGIVSTNAGSVAVGMGADVTVMARNLDQLRRVEDIWPGRVRTVPLSPESIRRTIEGADLLISGVLVHGGAAAPRLLSREDLRFIGAGAVIVDVSIDQGGIVETSRPTTHADPVYVEEGVIHYCVANMPGAVPRTSTAALTAATLPYVTLMANRSVAAALDSDASLARGLMTQDGKLMTDAISA